MQKVSYVNGQYTPHSNASVHIEDRGYQFADGVYEVIAIRNRECLDGPQHWKRLRRSLDAISIPFETSDGALNAITSELLRRNKIKNTFLYIQVTRGVAARNHAFSGPIKPSLVMSLLNAKSPSQEVIEKGIKVITTPDLRWARRDIKAIALLPNILAKQEAFKQKLKEAWLVDENGLISEGSSSNAYLVMEDGIIRTHPADENILGGITRDTVLSLAQEAGFKVEEKAFTKDDLSQAKEAFLTSTTSNVLPVVQVDEITIGNGVPGPITQELVSRYKEYCGIK